MLRAVQASSLPAQAETEGGGGNGFLRRRRRIPAPHGPFRRLPLMRSAAHPPRPAPAMAQRAGALSGGRLSSLPCPRGPGPGRVSTGAAGARSAAVGRRTQLRWGVPHRGGLGLAWQGKGKGQPPRSPRCYCGVGARRGRGAGGGCEGGGRFGGVPPLSEGPGPARLPHAPPTGPAVTPRLGSRKLLIFLFIKYPKLKRLARARCERVAATPGSQRRWRCLPGARRGTAGGRAGESGQAPRAGEMPLKTEETGEAHGLFGLVVPRRQKTLAEQPRRAGEGEVCGQQLYGRFHTRPPPRLEESPAGGCGPPWGAAASKWLRTDLLSSAYILLCSSLDALAKEAVRVKSQFVPVSQTVVFSQESILRLLAARRLEEAEYLLIKLIVVTNR